MFISKRTTLDQNAFVNSADKIKIFVSNFFYDNRNKLDAYLIQINLYVKRHDLQFKNTKNKVLFAITYFKNDAFKLFHYYMIDFLSKERNQKKDIINAIFNELRLFEKYLKRVFEDINKEKTVEKQLYDLRQKKLTVIYLINF